MQVAPFPFERVPFLRRHALRLWRALLANLGASSAAAIARWAERLGLSADEPCRLEAALLPNPEGVWPKSAALRFALHGPEGRSARLCLDAALAASIIALLLRAEPTPVCVPPSVGERGLVAYAVALLLQELGTLGWTVGLEEPHSEPSGALVEARLPGCCSRRRA